MRSWKRLAVIALCGGVLVCELIYFTVQHHTFAYAFRIFFQRQFAFYMVAYHIAGKYLYISKR